MYAYRRTYEETIHRFLTVFTRLKKIFLAERGPLFRGALGPGLAGLCLKTALLNGFHKQPKYNIIHYMTALTALLLSNFLGIPLAGFTRWPGFPPTSSVSKSANCEKSLSK